ncbi:MAG: glycine cleavage system protein GcvH [Candidatus Nanopelagicales bacterium]|jgi:glycine cleavage system H protein|nr:glycine cleavage system protein GcvH [Candidatus Nanopelagicales bacterium]
MTTNETTPGELRYTAEHEWVRANADGTLTVGITHHAQDALGDIVFVSLPAAGASVSAGATCGEVESTKSVSDIYNPVTGTIVEINGSVETNPEVINAEPYGAGWLFAITPHDAGDFDTLLSAADYRALINEV